MSLLLYSGLVAGGLVSSVASSAFRTEPDLNVNTTATSLALQWTKLTDGEAYGGTVDATGNIIQVGGAFPGCTPGYYGCTYDVTMIKYSADGTKLWTTYQGSSDSTKYDWGYGADVHELSGNIYVAASVGGSFMGQTSKGSDDVALIKYNSAGTPIWARQFGETANDVVFSNAVKVDVSEFAYIVGNIYASSSYTYYTSFRKYDSVGTLQFEQKITSTKSVRGTTVVLDSAGANAYVCGWAESSLNGQKYYGGRDIFITKYSSSGASAFTIQLGSSYDDMGYGGTIDSTDNAYFVGTTGGSLNSQISYGSGDAFLVKYSAAGVLIYTKQWGSSGSDIANGVAINPSTGKIYVSGYTSGSIDGQKNTGSYDIFLSEFNTDGTKAGTIMSGSTSYELNGALSMFSNNIYLFGYTDGNLNGADNTGDTITRDMYVLKYLA